MSDARALSCPVCSAPMARGRSAVRCGQSHSFDTARAGYVNLLVGRGARGRVGDSAEMVRARAQLLEAGHLAGVVEAVAETVAGADPGVEGCITELGCGTGAYLGAARERLGARAPSAWGFDLSKPAASAAARRHPEIGFAVADVQQRIPLLDSAARAAIAVFAPRPAAEAARVLVPGGCLVAAFATPRHLEGMRRRFELMSVRGAKLETLTTRLSPWFEPCGSYVVEYEVELGSEDVRRLVAMGPNARHVDISKIPAEPSRERISVEVATFRRS